MNFKLQIYHFFGLVAATGAFAATTAGAGGGAVFLALATAFFGY
ncbi:MAG: hypothetical protein ACKO96_35285 [Flammeovirgaceae bacterium]